VYNVDRTPNEQGAIHDIVDVIMQFHNHTKWAQFAVTGLGKSQMILGLSWLQEHNPKGDWATSEVRWVTIPPNVALAKTKLHRNIRFARPVKWGFALVGQAPSLIQRWTDPIFQMNSLIFPTCVLTMISVAMTQLKVNLKAKVGHMLVQVTYQLPDGNSQLIWSQLSTWVRTWSWLTPC